MKNENRKCFVGVCSHHDQKIDTMIRQNKLVRGPSKTVMESCLLPGSFGTVNARADLWSIGSRVVAVESVKRKPTFGSTIRVSGRKERNRTAFKILMARESLVAGDEDVMT